jgi:CheY-like chemotaxis protein
MSKDLDKKLNQLIDELKADVLSGLQPARKKESGISDEIESKLTNLLSDLERKSRGRSSGSGGPEGAEGSHEFLPEFGRYILIEKLGYGGMAETFKAKRAEAVDGRFCVLKRIRFQFKKENVMAVFLEEARLLARLSHPGIVPILDFGKLNEYGFLVFDYIEGMDIGAILNLLRARKRQLPAPALAHIGIQICQALEAAFATPGPGGVPLGIIHGNIIPANVLVTGSGEILISDFSLFRTALRLYQAVPASFRTKIAYLSPQQARGEPVDGRTDIYAIGSLLYEMATGEPVFPKTLDPAVFRKILLGQVIPVIPRGFEAPDALKKAILKALEYEPRNRQQKVEDLREELQAFLAESDRPDYAADDLGLLLADWFGGVFRERKRAAEEPARPAAKTETLRTVFPALEDLARRAAEPPAPAPQLEPVPEPVFDLDLELPAESEAPPAPKAEAAAVVEAVPEPGPPPLSRYRLLLVTPSGLIQKVVRMAFGDRDFELSLLAGGENAPGEIERYGPDAVILDLNSPQVGAYDLCEKIRANPHWSPISIILVRKEFEKIDQDRLDTLSYDLMIFMPVQAREFEEKVRFVLDQKKPLPGGGSGPRAGEPLI